jgi:hypothetical protein
LQIEQRLQIVEECVAAFKEKQEQRMNKRSQMAANSSALQIEVVSSVRITVRKLDLLGNAAGATG